MNEGVIQYRLQHTDGPAPDAALLQSLDLVRGRLFHAGLVGCDPGRYGGLGFGNVSRRHPEAGFIITGSQTGHRPHLTALQYVHVMCWDLQRFTLHSQGCLPPSSEAMTHAMLYDASADIQCVIHVHSPALWQAVSLDGFAETPVEIGYGSPGMATAMRDCVLSGAMGCIMRGHEDGIVMWGSDLERCADALIVRHHALTSGAR